MSDGLRQVELDDHEWGEVRLMFPIPKEGDPWGVLSVLKNTEWGDQLVIVSGGDLSHALHGWATPLMRALGVKPQVHGRRISPESGWCPQFHTCPISSKDCHPGRDLKECYTPPGLEGDAAILASLVALAWSDERYVIIVDGPEFNLS